MSKKNETTEATETPAPVRECVCGCGSPVKGKRAVWRQGHDARAKGWLQRVSAGRCFEGERELAEALLQRETHGALSTETFAPLARDARAALGLES